ncbi:hypothetical protein SAMN02745857_04269 [Andreprevotia lacus DSM 23236]|uniref:Uncharacterized protein n=1 Tax=Andreprevotia lacus DSM 23236 TaxID=1121001 RepID=A0A1W1Y1A0_9NEIS|nr:hypothetical protein SAMN02745857_04269 [Andreprevotia lacus DSM 23236]
MYLPDDIIQEIVDYVRQEFGEDPADPASLQPEQVAYRGEFDLDGVPTHYWQVGRNVWATVAPYGDDCYSIDITDVSPTPAPASDAYSTLYVRNFDGDVDLTIPLTASSGGSYSLGRYQPLALPDGEQLEIYAEAHPNSSPPLVFIGINDGDDNQYLRGAVGLSFNYTTRRGSLLLLTLGVVR